MEIPEKYQKPFTPTVQPDNSVKEPLLPEISAITSPSPSPTPITHPLSCPDFAVKIEDDFTLFADRKNNHNSQTINKSTSECLKCQQNCAEETLHCGLCSLEVHFSCYQNTQSKNNTTMSPSTYAALKTADNVKWFCNNCNTLSILDHILRIASVTIQTKVSSSIGKLSHDMDNLEQELTGDPTKVGSNAMDTHNRMTLSCKSIVDEKDTPKGPFSTLDAEEFESSACYIVTNEVNSCGITKEHNSSLSCTNAHVFNSPNRSDAEYSSSLPVPSTACKPFPNSNQLSIHSTPLSSRNSQSAFSETSSPAANSTNTLKVANHSISWNSKTDQKSLIDGDICQHCLSECSNHTTISCYICNVKTHFPCEKLDLCTGSSVSLILNDHENISNMEWFCNSCKGISFPEAATMVCKNVIKKETDTIRADVKTEVEGNQKKLNQGQKTNAHFPNFQEEICLMIKNTISKEVTLLKNDLLNKHHSDHIREETNVSTHPSSISTELESPTYTSMVSKSIPPSSPPRTSSENNSKRVKPELSLIIKNVQSQKFRNSSFCKSQFNKHFNCMRIKSIFSTQAGNIIVELYEKEDVEKVLREWKPHFFCLGDNMSSRHPTHIGLTSQSPRNIEVIIKHVNKHWTETDIKTELERPTSRNCYTNTTVKRFVKRNGDVLNTLKVTFTNNEDFANAVRVGVFLYGEHFKVEPFVQQPKAHQCYKCQNFGHPAKWCSRKLRCQYCSEEGHSGKDCILHGEVHEYKCANCNGQHSATYSQCPAYIKNLRKQESTHNSHHE